MKPRADKSLLTFFTILLLWFGAVTSATGWRMLNCVFPADAAIKELTMKPLDIEFLQICREVCMEVASYENRPLYKHQADEWMKENLNGIKSLERLKFSDISSMKFVKIVIRGLVLGDENPPAGAVAWLVEEQVKYLIEELKNLSLLPMDSSGYLACFRNMFTIS